MCGGGGAGPLCCVVTLPRSPTHAPSYLVDRANLRLFLDHGRGRQRLLSLEEAHELLLARGLGMDLYLVYCKLMRAGYIVQRHPARWVLKPSERPQLVWGKWWPDHAAEQQQQPAAAGLGGGGGEVGLVPPPAAPARQQHDQQHGQQQLRRLWWPALQTAEQPDAGAWPPQVPPDFEASLPVCTVAPPERSGKASQYPRMRPLEPMRLTDFSAARPKLLVRQTCGVSHPCGRLLRGVTGRPLPLPPLPAGS